MSQQRALSIPSNVRKRVQSNRQELDVSVMTAEEYLASVSLEAQTLPDVNVNIRSPQEAASSNGKASQRSVPIDGSAAMMHYLLSARTDIERASDVSKLPTSSPKDFCDDVLADFSTLRSYLENCSMGGVGSKNSERIPVPPMKDVAAWHEFCLGRDEAMGNVGGYFDDSENDVDEDDNNSEEIPQWKLNLPKDGMKPSVRILLQMDQVMARRVLEHQLCWVESGWPLSKQRGRWIYGLLARLDKPLHREDAATLRKFVKILCKKRNVGGNKQYIPVINVLLAIIGRYFEQASYCDLFEL